jgi:CRP-like cAMP-binding protein
MEILRDAGKADSHRAVLMDYLNENGLDGESILSIARRAEPVVFEPDEAVILQGKVADHVFFLVSGQVSVFARVDSEYRELGERKAVSVLGEISYFNGAAATADVVVKSGQPAVAFRLSYGKLTEIIAAFPGVKECLERIGDLRLISQANGFANYRLFMELIGNKQKRFLLDHQVLPQFELVLRNRLVPLLEGGKTVLEVGDGPGIVSELLLEQMPSAAERFFLQSMQMEKAILDPFTPLPSDLSRAKFLHRSFDALVALQVFNVVPAEHVMEQFRIARGIINPGGILCLFKVRLLNISYPTGTSETHLFFHLLQRIVERAWPGILEGRPLIETTFLDADLDALMGWNETLCRKAGAGLAIPPEVEGQERGLLGVLLDQARRQVFNPDALHFYWLALKAQGIGFTPLVSEHQPDLGFYYQIMRRE